MSCKVQIQEGDLCVVSIGTQGPPGPPTGPGLEIDKLEFFGLGTGPTKTTPNIIGDATIVEAFKLEDELYLQWVLPTGFDRTVNPKLVGSYLPMGSEVGTTVSWQVDFLADAHGTLLTGVSATQYIIDAPLPEVQYEALHGEMVIDAATLFAEEVDALHIRIKRIASTNDPSASVAIEHLGIEYTTTGRVGLQGPEGPPGPKGDPGTADITLTYNAGETLGGHRVVRIESGLVYYADNTTLAHAGKVIGITTGAVVSGSSTTIQVAGELEESTWSWSPGPVYLSTNGLLTQTPPATGFLQKIGTAITSTKILIRVIDPVIRI
jgi:hypothetical protein